jgi:hypothetical protein
MSFRPNRQAGQEKLQQWAREREERGEKPRREPALNTHPRANPDPDTQDLRVSVDRMEALLGR